MCVCVCVCVCVHVCVSGGVCVCVSLSVFVEIQYTFNVFLLPCEYFHLHQIALANNIVHLYDTVVLFI